MARALSHLMTKIRGSVGGITYSANQFYQIIMKTRTSPVQPNTTAQQLARNALTAAQATWETLTVAVRAAWDLYAQGNDWPDPMGTHKVPGRQTFMAGRSMQNYVLAATLATPTFVTAAPASFEGFYLPSTISLVDPVGIGTGIGVSVGAELLADGLFLIQIMGPFPTTRLRYKGPWDNALTQAAIVPLSTTAVVDILNLTVDMVYFVRVKAVADDTAPRVSAQTILRGVAVTVP